MTFLLPSPSCLLKLPNGRGRRLNIGASCSWLFEKSCVRVQRGWNLTTWQTEISRLWLLWNNSTHERVNWLAKYFVSFLQLKLNFTPWYPLNFVVNFCLIYYSFFFLWKTDTMKYFLSFYSLKTISNSSLVLSKPSNKMVEFYCVGD